MFFFNLFNKFTFSFKRKKKDPLEENTKNLVYQAKNDIYFKMDQTKNLDKKIILNKEKYNNQQNKIIQKEYENEKEEDNEIIIELQISNNKKEKEINILCDKEQLIKDNKEKEDYYKENNINPPKEFNYFNKNNTKLYLNDKEIEFNYKLKVEKIEINKIKIKSNIKLFSS